MTTNNMDEWPTFTRLLAEAKEGWYDFHDEECNCSGEELTAVFAVRQYLQAKMFRDNGVTMEELVKRAMAIEIPDPSEEEPGTE